MLLSRLAMMPLKSLPHTVKSPDCPAVTALKKLPATVLVGGLRQAEPPARRLGAQW